MASTPLIIDPGSTIIRPTRGPLIKQAKVKWERDSAISDLIEYFDEPRFHGPKIKSDGDRFALLTLKEIRAIEDLARKCREDFTYCARNFFWITNKKRIPILFKLWESQELIYERLMALKAKGLAMKLMILKARQLGSSTVIEGLIAWRTMLFPNVNAIVVSYDPEHAAYLFSIMQRMLDMMPWFLKPQVFTREYKDGLRFDNPDAEDRRLNPGLNSSVMVQAANKRTGVGTGTRLSAGHLCFVPGTPIIVHDGFVKRIEETLVDDGAIDSNGALTTVRGVYKSKRKNEETAEIKVWGCYDPLRTTIDHRVYTANGDREAGTIRKGEWIRFPVRRITRENKHIQIIHQATGGDHKNKESREYATYLPTNYETGWMFGLYLAEGTIMFNRKQSNLKFRARSLMFAIDCDEQDRVVGRILAATLNRDTVTPYRHKTSRTVAINLYNAGLARFIEQHFGYCDEKTVPDWAWQCGEEFCKGILAGYMSGDGHTSKGGTASVMATSIRLAILVQMRALAASLGIGWSAITHRDGGFHYGMNCQETWTLFFSGTAAIEVGKLRGKPCSQTPSNRGYHWKYSQCQQWIDLEVREVTRGFSEEFYDLEVESTEHKFCTLSACVSNSEYGLWQQDYARDVIEQDIGNALAEDDPDMFCVLESTARGAGNYSYRLWNKNVELGEQAEWHPLFLPWFFESSRFIAPPNGWHPEPPEVQMNERVQIDWLRCDNSNCEQYQERYRKTEDLDGTACPTCGTGKLDLYKLKPGQMYFMQRKRKNAEKESESLKKLQQELASTAESAFTLSGISVFGDGAQEYVNSTIRPPLKEGFLDKNGKFHGCNPKNIKKNSATGEYYEACYLGGCDQDHSFGDENGENPFHVWKEPETDIEYCIGADVAEGLGGEYDYSVGFVLRVNKHGGPDEQVATFRSNMIDPVAFAQVLNWIGRAYNEALMCIEVNRYDTCMTWIRFQLQYPNLYRWKHLDSINPLSNKLGWLTQANTKPRLYQTLKRWLQFKLIILYSKNLANELKTFTKENYEERGAGAESGSYDDEAMACQIALYCAHEGDWDDSVGQMAVTRPLTWEEAPVHRLCKSCDLKWAARNYEEKQCPRCGSMVIEGTANRSQKPEDEGSNQTDPFFEGQTIGKYDAQEYSVDTNYHEKPEPEFELL